MNLIAPEEYFRLSPEVKAEIVNGCGPAGWKSKFIPDHLLGLSIKDACDIHDYMYEVGVTEDDRLHADRTFLDNMLTIIEENTGNLFLKKERRNMALDYYSAVRDFGESAFMVGKGVK